MLLISSSDYLSARSTVMVFYQISPPFLETHTKLFSKTCCLFPANTQLQVNRGSSHNPKQLTETINTIVTTQLPEKPEPQVFPLSISVSFQKNCISLFFPIHHLPSSLTRHLKISYWVTFLLSLPLLSLSVHQSTPSRKLRKTFHSASFLPLLLCFHSSMDSSGNTS